MRKIIIGTPETDSHFFDGIQSYSDTCAIRCQEAILQQFLNKDINEDTLIKQAIELGVYTGHGTQPQHIGALLEANGIEIDRYYNATMHDLTMALADGKKIIVGVDSGELWEKSIFSESQEELEDMLGISKADHAVIVCGIDTSDPENIKVILTDPGTGDNAISYDMETFIDAWRDSNCMLVSTVEPAPHWLPEMVNFDYDIGHIPLIGDVPYNIIESYDKAEFSHNGLSLFSSNEESTEFFNNKNTNSLLDHLEQGVETNDDTLNNNIVETDENIFSRKAVVFNHPSELNDLNNNNIKDDIFGTDINTDIDGSLDEMDHENDINCDDIDDIDLPDFDF